MNNDTVVEIGLDAVVEVLSKRKFRNKLVSKLNENVDIPFINEQTEEKIIEAIYDVVLSAVKDMND